MKNIKKILPSNTVVFRERHDYGPIPAVYYYFNWISNRCNKYYGAKITYAIQSSIGAYHKGTSRAMLGKKYQWNKLCKSILKKILTKKYFVNNTNKKGIKTAKEYRNFSRYVISKNGNFLSDKQLISIHKKWIWFYNEYSFWNCLLWLASSDLLVKHVDLILKKQYKVNSSDAQILTTPTEPSFSYREEIELLKIASKVNFKKIKIENQQPWVQLLIEKHVRKWEFIPWDYIGPNHLTSIKLFKTIFKTVSNQEEAKELINMKLNYFKSIKIQKNKIIKKYKIKKEHVRLIDDLKILTLMQDEKKEVCTLAQYALHNSIFDYIGNKLKIPARACIKFTENELWDMMQDNKIRDKLVKTLPQRLNSVTGITDKFGVYIFYGKESRKLYNKFSTKINIKNKVLGQIASLGKYQGKAKILLSTKNLSKIKKGDILIARMTTPDYISAMKLAGAIVTDEGGLTSHAAIIARELRIPCIVGTKISTKFFQDNEQILVDAQKGFIKRINITK